MSEPYATLFAPANHIHSGTTYGLELIGRPCGRHATQGGVPTRQVRRPAQTPNGCCKVKELRGNRVQSNGMVGRGKRDTFCHGAHSVSRGFSITIEFRYYVAI